MRFIRIIPIVLLTSIFPVLSAQADLAAGNSNFQSCGSNNECVLVSQTCATSCASLPVNVKFEKAYIDKRVQQCGASVSNLPVCHTNPPMRAACINNRCTIDYAHVHNSHDGDYRNGGYQGVEHTATLE